MKGRINKISRLIPVLFIILLLVSSFPLVVASDHITISFDPHPDEPPYEPINPEPSNESTGVSTSATLSVIVYDETNDPVDVYFYNAEDDSLIGVDYGVSSDWSTASIEWSGLVQGTLYYWYVIVRVHGYSTQSETWHFETASGGGSPGGGSPDIPGGFIPAPPPNQVPVANITALSKGYVNENLLFSAYHSYDPDGEIVGYRWDFNNDSVYDTDWLEDSLIAYAYQSPGVYLIRLEVIDDDNATATSDLHMVLISPLAQSFELPVAKTNDSYSGYTNEIITFNGNKSYDPDGTIVSWTWDFGDGTKSTLKNPTHTYSKSGNYTVSLTVTDDDDLSNSTTTKVIVIDREIKEKEKERDLPLTWLGVIGMISILGILYFIVIRRKNEQDKEEPEEKTNEEIDNAEKGELKGKELKLFETTNKNIDNEVEELLLDLENKHSKIIEHGVEEISSDLIKIMYSEDVDSDFVTEQLGISFEELQALVDILVKHGLLRYSSEDELELTEKAIRYIESK